MLKMIYMHYYWRHSNYNWALFVIK